MTTAAPPTSAPAGPITITATPPPEPDIADKPPTADGLPSAEDDVEPHLDPDLEPDLGPDPGAPEAVEIPADQAGIDVLRTEIDAIDAELIRLIQRRTALSHAIGAARKSFGGTRIVYSREMAILDRFRELGPYGTDLGMMLLAMGRGRLGRK